MHVPKRLQGSELESTTVVFGISWICIVGVIWHVFDFGLPTNDTKDVLLKM